jgi:hypothetical protein
MLENIKERNPDNMAKRLAGQTMVYRDAPTMVIISNYEESVNKSGEICIKTTEKSVCTICAGNLIVIGIRRRCVITAEDEKKIYRIRRLRCVESCGKIHHELPDSIIPYKRYSAETIEKIEENRVAGLSIESATIVKLMKFIKRIRTLYQNAVSGLKEKYRDLEFPESPLLRKLVRILVNGNLWAHTRSAYVRI